MHVIFDEDLLIAILVYKSPQSFGVVITYKCRQSLIAAQHIIAGASPPSMRARSALPR